MVTRKELLKNVRNYSPQEIADAVRAGIVSLYDLTKETEGAFTPLLKRQVKTILDTPVPAQQATITNVQTPSEEKASINEVPTNPIETPSMPVSDTAIPVSEPTIPVVSFTGSIDDSSTEEQVANPQIQSSSQLDEKKPAMFSRIFSFNGRIRRLEYGLTYLVYCLWNIPMQVMPGDQISEGYAIFYLVTFIPILWIILAQGAKRCHDRGNSGWYQIIPFYFFWMIFAEGDSESNEYGENPKD